MAERKISITEIQYRRTKINGEIRYTENTPEGRVRRIITRGPNDFVGVNESVSFNVEMGAYSDMYAANKNSTKSHEQKRKEGSNEAARRIFERFPQEAITITYERPKPEAWPKIFQKPSTN